MRRFLVPLLIAACAAVALVGVFSVGVVGWVVADAARTPDPDPRGVDTLDRDDVVRLSGLELPTDLPGLHTSYDEGIDYSLVACFRVARAELPADLPALGKATLDVTPPPGCPAPGPRLRGTPQHRDGPLFRTVWVDDPGSGPVTVYVQAFTT